MQMYNKTRKVLPSRIIGLVYVGFHGMFYMCFIIHLCNFSEMISSYQHDSPLPIHPTDTDCRGTHILPRLTAIYL